MFRKYLLTSLFVAGFFLPATAQEGYRKANAAEVGEMQKNIATSSTGMKSLRCAFEQTKTLSILAEEVHSTGFLIYRQPDKLHWEYMTPYHYLFAMNDGKVTIASGDSKNEIDIASNRLFREISSIIVSGINGQDIFNETRFSLKYLTGTSGYLMALTPKQKDIKQLFHEIRLYFDAKDHTVNVVEIEETGGDKTVIRMKNKQINTKIEDAVFDIP
jgi:outer membrane lipoprotein carrier protein